MASYGCNNNQNAFVAEGYTTSRVLAPPGGQTSLSFGVAPPPARRRKEQQVEEESPVAVVQEEEEKKEEEMVDKNKEEEKASAADCKLEENTTRKERENEKTKDDKPEVKRNQACASATKQFRPSSRVLAPPGGHTSIKLW